MLAGHYSTALWAYQKFPKGTLLFYLVASQLQDLLWLTFHYLGMEPTLPSELIEVTLQGLNVDMQYSHDLLPQIFWVVVIFIAGRMIFKSNTVGLVGVALVLGHFVLDFLSGYSHHIFGEGSHNVGLALYLSNVYLAIGIEAFVISLMLWFFFLEDRKKGVNRTLNNKLAIIGLFVFGIVFLLFIAQTSLGEWFGVSGVNSGFNTTIPSLIMTYVGMIFYLNYFVVKAMDTKTEGVISEH